MDNWKPDQKYLIEAQSAMKRTQANLETGILTKYRVLRTQQIEGLVVENCYKKKNLNVLEAEQCDHFHHQNDYKLNLLNTFFKDHAAKHILSYQQCEREVANLESIAEKDKAYADCHNNWLSDFKNNQSEDLELRARKLFGKNLEA